MNENKIKHLFDFHHFQQNSKLNSVIQAVEERYTNAFADDDLALVSAAGDGAPQSTEDAEVGGYGDLLRVIDTKR